MSIVDLIAEKRIREAIDRGELDDLPGKGEPLELEDLSMVPESLRPGYIMLKNAGFVPPEMHTRREIRRVEDLLREVSDDDESTRAELRGRLAVLEARLEREGGRRIPAHVRREYAGRLTARFERDR